MTQRPSGARFSSDVRQTAMRRVACCFPQDHRGVSIERGEDAAVQLVNYLAEKVHPIENVSLRAHHRLIELITATLIEEGLIYLNRRGDEWRIGEKYRRSQKGQAQRKSASNKERVRRRHAGHGYEPSFG